MLKYLSLACGLLLQTFSLLYAQEVKPVKIGDVSTGTLIYPALDNIDLREGTIECWVQFAFHPLEYLPAKEYLLMLSLWNVGTPRGGMSVSFMVQPGESNATWFCSMGPKPRIHGTFIGTPGSDLFGKWQHIALAWRHRETRAYLDGKLQGQVEHLIPPHQIWGSLGVKPIFFGDQWNRYALLVMDDLRISRIAREPGELGFTAGELKPDPFTTVLDPFETEFIPDGKLETKPLLIANGVGGLPSPQCRFVPGKFGKGLAFFNEGEGKAK
jgi:hypothetical protein